jgi:antitoxin (DNA-binding transcriptional repressor) of toxin-antitoxin stability system
MKTATVRDLRNNFGRLSKWLEAGETVQIVKKGRPFARVMPEPKKPKTFLGACQSPFPLPADIDDPVDVEWEAMK